MKQQLLGNEELKSLKALNSVCAHFGADIDKVVKIGGSQTHLNVPLDIDGYEDKLFKVYFECGCLVKNEYDGKIKRRVHFLIREIGNWWNWGSFACDFSI